MNAEAQSVVPKPGDRVSVDGGVLATVRYVYADDVTVLLDPPQAAYLTLPLIRVEPFPAPSLDDKPPRP